MQGGCHVKNESDSIQPLFQPLQQANDENCIPDELEAYVWGCGEGGAQGEITLGIAYFVARNLFTSN